MLCHQGYHRSAVHFVDKLAFDQRFSMKDVSTSFILKSVSQIFVLFRLISEKSRSTLAEEIGSTLKMSNSSNNNGNHPLHVLCKFVPKVFSLLDQMDDIEIIRFSKPT